MIISLDDYFRSMEKPDYHVANARDLLGKVNSLLAFAETQGLTLRINPNRQCAATANKLTDQKTAATKLNLLAHLTPNQPRREYDSYD